ncbi:unnamed protein product [Rotaria socialis]|uniref:Uncharacterized protein n=1 Tax=Rotaria socialis TaxID=392032 RepID=A0A818W764_9BILA|nr:unnamed protein product [Rotaria socialis]CAF3313864.1 unnamed protein product [Rotaria socialis]CAF3442584.1 unnamed protein product [Rotaria socialis]CAF3721302.1 unnamed protein product [Rotaria socialis]
MAKQIQSLTVMNVKLEETERVEMATLLKTKSNSTVEVLSELIEDPLTNENDKAKYICKRIYINYEKKNWINAIEDISKYQQITKSKKLELLKMNCCNAVINLE